jgi:hypothetical protein
VLLLRNVCVRAVDCIFLSVVSPFGWIVVQLAGVLVFLFGL